LNGILKNPKPMRVYTGDGDFEFTPKTELGLLLAEHQNKLAKEGVKPHTSDEILKALELERSGYDGLGRLWRNETLTLTQV